MNRKQCFKPGKPAVTEEGQGLVEYAMIMVLFVIVVITALAVLGPKIGQLYSQITLAVQYPDLGFTATAVRQNDPSGDQVEVTITASREVSITLANPANGYSSTAVCSGTCVYTIPTPGSAAGAIQISSHGATISLSYPAH